MKQSILFAAICCLIFCVSESSAQKTRKRTPAKKPVPVVKTAPEELLLEPKVPDVEFKPVGPADADGWRVYRSTEDSFKLAFPSEPVVTDSVDNAGKKDGNRYYNPEPSTAARISLTMMVQPLGLPSISADFKRKVYEAWAEGVLADQGGQKTTLVSQKEFAFDNSFGLEVIADRGSYRFRGRIVCLADRCYQYSAGSGTPDALKPEENADAEKWVKKFFDSFQLIKTNLPN